MASKLSQPQQQQSKKPELRIVLVGKTGVGKSAVGNTILRRNAFISQLSSSSVTTQCKKETGELDRQSMAVVDTPGSGLSTDLRLVLVGQERVGKSAAGNTILGRKEFASSLSFSPVTLRSEKREGDVLERRVTVVDTPGLCSSQLSEEQVRAELEEALQLSAPGPHAFLLTHQLGRFTQQEQKGMETLDKMLCPAVRCYTTVLFTYGDRLGDTDIERFIREDENLQKLLQKCGGRYHVFNNKEAGNTDQVRELLDKIELSRKGQHPYYERSPSQSKESALISRVNQLFQTMWTVLVFCSRWIGIRASPDDREREREVGEIVWERVRRVGRFFFCRKSLLLMAGGALTLGSIYYLSRWRGFHEKVIADQNH